MAEAWPRSLPPDWLQLEAHEPDLRDGPLTPGAVVYRLIWLRAFHDPIVVRLVADPDSAVVRWKTGKQAELPDQPALPYRPPFPSAVAWSCGHRTVPLAMAAAVARDFAQAGFWALPDTLPQPDPNVLQLDGSHWLLEVRGGGRSHQVVSRPVDPVIERLGLTLVRLTRLRLDRRDIY